MVLAAAAVLVLVAAVGAVAIRADRRADQAEQLAAIVADPAADSVEVTGPAGTMRLVVSPRPRQLGPARRRHARRAERQGL